MTWRSIVITKPARLHYERKQLVVEQEQTVNVPLEDIAVILLESPQCTITGQLLSELAERGIALLTCASNHIPNGVLLSYLPHSRQTRMMRLQMALTEPQRKRAWAIIITAKLNNQAACLRILKLDGADRLESLARQVRSGDPDNLEAQGAAFYFGKLFNNNFRRNDDIFVNSALDYGYAVLRAAVARGLVIHGFLPPLGLFHRSEQNAFNLADDFLEPFRPLVDLWVATNWKLMASDSRLEPPHKAALVNLLHHDMAINDDCLAALAAIERVCDSFVTMCEKSDFQRVVTPTLLPLNLHSNE